MKVLGIVTVTKSGRIRGVFIRIQGVQQYLWRAVDQNGVVLDILVQARRDGNAAKRFLRRLLKGLQYVPRVIVTDKLRVMVSLGVNCFRASSTDKADI
jgi:transposase-like protein